MNNTENYPKYALPGRMEIHPCVLQDIGPLGPLPCSHTTSSAITPSRASGTADHVQSLDDLLILPLKTDFFLVFFHIFFVLLLLVIYSNGV